MTTWIDQLLSRGINEGAGVEEKWFAFFGSVPSNYDGTAMADWKVYVVDRTTGDPSSQFRIIGFRDSETNAFMTLLSPLMLA
jgi:hypothetical protein